MTLKVQLVMLCCKKTYLYSLLWVLSVLYFQPRQNWGVVAFEITQLCHILR